MKKNAWQFIAKLKTVCGHSSPQGYRLIGKFPGIPMGKSGPGHD